MLQGMLESGKGFYLNLLVAFWSSNKAIQQYTKKKVA